MPLHLSDLNIALTADDVLKALMGADSKELLKLKYALQKIVDKSSFVERGNHVNHLTQKMKKCPHCNEKFHPTGNAQRFCCVEHSKCFHKKEVERKYLNHLQDNPQVATLPKKEFPIEREPPISPAKRPDGNGIWIT